MKKAAFVLAIALGGALLIVSLSPDRSYEEALIRAGLEETFGADAQELLDETPELQTLFLDYAETPELVFKSRIAISKYGDDARTVLELYGAEPEFQDVLKRYGENTIPIIFYFIENDPFSLYMAYVAREKIQETTERGKELLVACFGSDAQQEELLQKRFAQDEQAELEMSSRYDAETRGWLAIEKINNDGHDFLGQFAIGADNSVYWVKVERVLEAASSFFTSGVRNFEVKVGLEEEIEKADYFWAAVDVAVVTSSVKALRVLKAARGTQAAAQTGKVASGAGKAGAALRTGKAAAQTARLGQAGVKSTRQVGFLKRTKLLAGRLIPKNALGRTILKAGVGTGLVYIAVKHPSIIDSMFTELAHFLDLNPLFVQIVCWTLVISILCFPLIWVLKLLIPPLAGLLIFSGRVLGRFDRRATPPQTA